MQLEERDQVHVGVEEKVSVHVQHQFFTAHNEFLQPCSHPLIMVVGSKVYSMWEKRLV